MITKEYTLTTKVQTIKKIVELQNILKKHYKKDFSLDDTILIAIDYLKNKLNIDS